MRPVELQGYEAGRSQARFGPDAAGAAASPAVSSAVSKAAVTVAAKAAASLGVWRIGLETIAGWAGFGGQRRGAASGSESGQSAVAGRNSSAQARLGFGGSRRAVAGGLTGWLLMKLRRDGRPRPQLAVLERISLAPRQSLTLIEAGGQRLLVATSADGTPAFYPVGGRARQTAVQGRPPARASSGRVSW
jgi:hypothetical protein